MSQSGPIVLAGSNGGGGGGSQNLQQVTTVGRNTNVGVNVQATTSALSLDPDFVGDNVVVNWTKGVHDMAVTLDTLTGDHGVNLTDADGAIQVSGNGLVIPLRSVSANTTLLRRDYCILVDASAAPVTVFCNPASGIVADQQWIIKIKALGNNVTLTPTGGSAIDNTAAVTIVGTATLQSLVLEFDGTNFWIVSAYQAAPATPNLQAVTAVGRNTNIGVNVTGLNSTGIVIEPNNISGNTQLQAFTATSGYTLVADHTAAEPVILISKNANLLTINTEVLNANWTQTRPNRDGVYQVSNNGLALPSVKVTANYTVLRKDYLIEVDTTAGTVAIVLDSTNGSVNQEWAIIVIGLNNCTITPSGGKTINGVASITLTGTTLAGGISYNTVTVKYDGTNYFVIGSYLPGTTAVSTLQQVTTAGNTTNQDIIEQVTIPAAGVYNNTFGIVANTGGTGGAFIQALGTTGSPAPFYVRLWANSLREQPMIVFKQGGGNGTLSLFPPPTINVGGRGVFLPDEDGTIVLGTHGTTSLSGTGVATSFTFTVTTGYGNCIVQSKNLVATIISSSIVSGTGVITVNMLAAPAVGVNNIVLSYMAFN